VVKKSILITGGLGYLGGQLSRYFLGEGFNVIIVTQCKELFNFSPKLIYSTDEVKNTAPLIYKIDKLVNEIGYEPANNLVSSVNEILEFCDSEFN
jgi:NAD(P)-dependent dehydrogenase (short-subunit alcohol dehydrogenase family)